MSTEQEINEFAEDDNWFDSDWADWERNHGGNKEQETTAHIFTLKINLGNSGMVTQHDVACALANVRNNIIRTGSWNGIVHNIDGNPVGKWGVL